MKNLFKRKKEQSVSTTILAGKVKFILDSEIKTGTIFGQPYKAPAVMFSPGGLTYHIVDEAGKVHDIKSHAIESA